MLSGDCENCWSIILNRQCLPGLERLELIDLQLTGTDGKTKQPFLLIEPHLNVVAEHALDEVGDVCRFSLQTLKIVNISRLECCLINIIIIALVQIAILSPGFHSP